MQMMYGMVRPAGLEVSAARIAGRLDRTLDAALDADDVWHGHAGRGWKRPDPAARRGRRRHPSMQMMYGMVMPGVSGGSGGVSGSGGSTTPSTLPSMQMMYGMVMPKNIGL
jgi:hypothetical protein